MRLKPITWALISVLLFVAGIVFWKLGDRQMVGKRGTDKPASERIATNEVSARSPAMVVDEVVVVLPPTLFQSSSFKALKADVTNSKDPLRYRLSNTKKASGELARSEGGLLLRNALIDTTARESLGVPEELLLEGDPGSYIVQSRTTLNEAFREQLRAANAEIVSYVPNNAYLVRVSGNGAQKIAAFAQTQSVIPYEPYFKLDHPVLVRAIEDKPFEAGAKLRVTLFPGALEEASEELLKMGVRILGNERSPFGPELVVQMPVESLIAVARMPSVQNVEFLTERIKSNDMARERVGVSTNTTDLVNSFGLTGTNIWVNVNDGGIDGNHPDLTNRVFVGERTLPIDFDGHGTHVAGIIGSTGASGPVPGSLAVGSLDGANFRGMAPNSRILSLDIFEFFDWEIQETAARTNWFVFGRTNTLISNNSWGYVNSYGYNSAAASFDAAVRDSIPGVTGSQPVLFVFAAGNDGGGNLSGTDGFAGSINSPATAKNVITVGALEQPRGITNWIFLTNQNSQGSNVVSSNLTYLARTDSSNEVAFYSARGNVGIGVEGEFGRLKPDVVAPGSFLVSTRSGDWDTNSYYNPTNISVRFYTNFVLKAGKTNFFAISIPDNAVEFWIDALRTSPEVPPLPTLLIYTNTAPRPSTNAAFFAATNSLHVNHTDDGFERSVEWFYDFVNTNSVDVTYSVRTVVFSTNDYGNELHILQELNEKLLGPNGPPPRYRYESGTSMAAPVVSGMLALLQEYLETRITPAVSNASPALMKALLINSARSAGPAYDLNTEVAFNAQGWGLPRLGRMLPGAQDSGPLLFVDQSQTNALATDEIQTRQLLVTEDAQFAPIRVSLVWTDPPGNPAVGIKLVNDLDLVVTNLDTGDVYFGNYFPGGGDFSGVNLFLEDTNLPPVVLNGDRDIVNNVENIYLNSPVGTRYAISVVGKRVNVNAVTTQPNGIRQDYALVVSSGDLSITNALSFTNFTSSGAVSANVTSLTNLNGGLPGPGYSLALLNGQRVGANNPYELQTQTNGTLNQWRFYVFTNQSGYTNVAFAAFGSKDLSGVATRDYQVPSLRNLDADIDLFVSTNQNLTNLNQTTVNQAFKSVTRGGNELIVLTNSASVSNQVFYIGVKSEDQRSAEFGLLAIASALPFAAQDGNGVRPLFFPLPAVIEDGSPFDPGTVEVLGIMPVDFDIRCLIVTTAFDHQLFGDLVGVFSRYGGRKSVYLNNHGPMDGKSSGVVTNFYNDLDEGDTPDAVPTDGPGSLADFVGDKAFGLWSLSVTDNALSHTGSVLNVSFLAEAQPKAPDDGGPEIVSAEICRTIFANSQRYDSIRVPAGATNLTITAEFASGPIEVYVRRGQIPTTTEYDHFASIPAPAGSISIGLGDVPRLRRGTYYIMFRNPGASPVEVCWIKRIGRDLTGVGIDVVTSTNQVPILDDALTNLVINVTNEGLVAEVEVGVRIEHPRVADLSMHLVSPVGTRILLFENRGWNTTNGLGSDVPISSTNSVQVMSSGFEGVVPANYASPAIVDGWTVGSNKVTVVNNAVGAFQGANYADLNDSFITRNLPTVQSNRYTLSYAYRGISTNLFKNPGFEFGPTNWTFESGTGVSGAIGNRSASSGSFFAVIGTNDIFGSSVFQAFPVVGGRTYQVEFDISKYGTPGETATLNVSISTTANGVIAAQSYPLPVINNNPITWETKTISFTVPPGNSSATLKFADFGAEAGSDIVVDRVSIFPTPVGRVGLTGVITNTHTGTSVWQTNSVQFVAPASGTLLRVSAVDLGMLVDGFSLVEEQVSSPVNYMVFTETTNATTELIKFAQPPYGVGGTNGVILSNSFETAGVSNYSIGSTVEGWSVAASNVSVQTEVAYAHSGTNVLAINVRPGTTNGPDGAVTRAFTNAPRERFILSFMHRRPHSSLINWWTADNTTNDVIGGQNATMVNGATFAAGLVGSAFQLNNATKSHVNCGTRAGNFGTNDFTIEFWMNTTATPNSYVMSKRAGCGPGNFWNILMGNNGIGDGRIQFEINDPSQGLYDSYIAPTAVNNGAYHHLAITRQGRLFSTYIDGVLSASKLSAGIFNLTNTAALRFGMSDCIPTGPTTEFTGKLDEIGFHNRAISTNELRSIVLAGSAGRFDSSNPPTNAPTSQSLVISGGSTNVFTSGTNWATFKTLVSPQGTNFTIQIAGQTNGVWIDSLQLSKFSGQFYHPEESLNLLVGEEAKGDWTLEVWDTRLGAALNARSISWQLELGLTEGGPDPTVIPLMDGVTSTNAAVSNSITYFVVQVPINATAATNTLTSLTGGAIELLFNQNALPTSSGPGDFSLFATSAQNSYVIDTIGSTPALQPGRRYYLGVRNINSAESNNFVLKVEFNLTPQTLNVPSLTNQVPYTNTIPAGFAMQYYEFKVSTNAISADFEILNPTGDVDLFLRKGTPVPTYNSYDYTSQNLSVANELVTVTPTSQPVPLTSGSWYIGVLNQSGGPVTYQVRVTETLAAQTNIITLVSGVPQNGVTRAGALLTNFYKLTINQSNPSVLFELVNLTGNVDMLIRRGNLPSLTLFDYSSANTGTTGEQVVLATNALLPTLNGDWFIAVPNNEAFNVNFTIHAVVTTNGVLPSTSPIRIFSLSSAGGMLSFQWNSVNGETYEVQSSPDLINPITWTVVGAPVTATGPVSNFTSAPIANAPTLFYRVVQVP